MEVVKRIGPILPYVCTTYLMGNGEPLLNKDFIEILKIMKENLLPVSFNTNGTLLSEDYAREFIRLGVDIIAFSIDGATQETFESIRRGAKYEQVIANIRRLNELKGSLKKPKLVFANVVTASNVHEAAGLIELAHSVGVKEVFFETLYHNFNNPEYEEMYKELNLSNVPDQKIKDYFEEAGKVAESLEVYMSAKFLDSKTDSSENIGDGKDSEDGDNIIGNQDTPFCAEPWTTTFITWDGDVKTCCRSGKVFGNVLKENILKIWNNEEYRAYRKSIINKTTPAECKTCRANHTETNVIPWVEAQFLNGVIENKDTDTVNLDGIIRDAELQNNRPAFKVVDNALIKVLLYIPADRDFINECYIKILGRKPDGDGLSAYLARLNKGRSRTSIISSLAHSFEAISKGVVYKSPDNLSFKDKIRYISKMFYDRFTRPLKIF